MEAVEEYGELDTGVDKVDTVANPVVELVVDPIVEVVVDPEVELVADPEVDPEIDPVAVEGWDKVEKYVEPRLSTIVVDEPVTVARLSLVTVGTSSSK
jgi:hypothetical protein